jgi:hypothetical protein
LNSNSNNNINHINLISFISNTNTNSNLNSTHKDFNAKNNSNEMKNNGKEEYVDFKVNLENIITGKDKRTTIMLRNIPNKYTLQNLVDEINTLFLGRYDYINLPIDYEVNKTNKYKMINFFI